MSDFFGLIESLLVGFFIGAVFFVGLFWTVQNIIVGQRSPLWFFPSLVLRSAVVLFGFYWIAKHGFGQLILALIGFVLARFASERLTAAKKVRHAN